MRSAILALLALSLLPASASAAAGDLDRRFGEDGLVVISLAEASTQARAITVQPDGKVLVTGTAYNGSVVTRLLPSGKPDARFGRRGRALLPFAEPMAIEVMADGRIVVGGSLHSNGSSSELQVARLLPDGRTDGSWGEAGVGTLKASARLFFGGLAVQPDGGVAVASSMHDGDQKLVVMRLGPDGRPDRGFGDGGAHVEPYAAGSAILSIGGRLIVSGETGSYFGASSELILALTHSGRPDRTWGRDGRLVGPSGFFADELEAAPDGDVIVLGGTYSHPALLRLRPDGKRDDEWGLEGRTTAAAAGRQVTGHALDRAGQVYFTGTVDSSPTSMKTIPTLARVNAAGVPDFGFARGARARMPIRKPLVRAIGEDVAVAANQRVYVAASGSDGFAGDREDYGYTHAVVAAYKGWEQLVTLHRPAVTPIRRRLAVSARCRGTGRCRVRVEVRDRRGRRVARTTLTRRAPFERRVAMTPSRRLRRGERLIIRASATNSLGQADRTRHRVRVPRPRR